MIDFLNNKGEFLEKFSNGSYAITPILIGFVFSFVQKEMKEKIDLFRSLKRIKNEVSDLNQVCYAVIKALKSAEFYIDNYQSEEFIEIYCEITAGIGVMRIPKSLEPKIQNLFSQNWSKLARKYAKTENFYKIFLLGKKNIRLFYRTPLVLNAENENLMKKLIQDKDELDSDTLITIFQLLRALRPANYEDDSNMLKDFLSFKVKHYFRKTQNFEVVNEIKKKIEENLNVFDELTMSELKQIYTNRLSSKDQLIQIHADKPIQKPKVEFNQYPKKDPVEFYEEKPAQIKIPVKTYSNQNIQSYPNPQQYQNKPIPQNRPAYFNKADEAPKEINLNTESIEHNIRDVIQACLSENNNEKIDQNQIKSIFKGFEKHEITFPNQLHKVLKETLEADYDEDKFAVLEMIVDISKEFLQRGEFAEILNMAKEKNAEKSRNVQVKRGNFMAADLDRQAYEEAANNPIYVQSGWGGAHEKEESKNKINEVVELESVRSKEEKDEQELFYQVQVSNYKFENKEVENCYQVEQPRPDNQAIHDNPNLAESASSCGYIKIISISCKNFIEFLISQTSDIARINSPLIKLKSLLQENSPSAKLNLIGSAYTGTYIRNLEVDVNFYDYHHSDPKNLLKSCLLRLNLENRGELPNNLYFSSGEATYIIHINLDLYYETSTLVKTYCNLDPRCKELITLVKYWARRVEVYGTNLSGYHISLICITYLQLCTPPILPTLQTQVHTPEYIGEIDVWFDKSLDFFSMNTLSLGDIFINFFGFILHCSLGYTFYPSLGQVIPNENDMVFSCCSLFGNSQVSKVSRSSEEGIKLIEAVRETVLLINSNENLYKIMRIN